MPGRFLRHSQWLKHISMLDVFIMGIIVVTAAGSAYSEQGTSPGATGCLREKGFPASLVILVEVAGRL